MAGPPKKHRVKPASGSEPASENTQGLVVPKTAPNTSATASTNPPVKAETPQEQSLLQKAGELLDKGEIPILSQAKDALKGGATAVLGTGIVGLIGAGAIEVLFPTNVIDLIPGGKIVSGSKKAAKLGEAALKTAGKGAAEKAAKEAAGKEAKQAAGQGGAYAKKAGKKGPCDHLRQGSGTGPHRGGAHSKTSTPANDSMDSHHVPAKDASPLKHGDGPAIQMRPQDHAKTSSNGQMAGSIDYREMIVRLIESGNWRKAMAIEVADVRRVAREAGDSKRYNEPLLEMLAYYKCLEKNALLK